MKTTAMYRNERRVGIPYPNAADRRKLLEKFVDHLLIGAICVAGVTALMFFLTLA